MLREHHRASFVLSPKGAAAADALAIARGQSALDLTDRAAAACIKALRGRWSRRPVCVVCGPGQNGGDGWVIAQRLTEAGWPVSLHADTPPLALTGAAREAALRSGLTPRPLSEFSSRKGHLVVDALFGAGLSRPLTGVALATIQRVQESGADVLAVDLPSGLDGLTGAPRPVAARATMTVTFHRPKPGHLLNPGRKLCGELIVADIGLGEGGEPCAFRNQPGLWLLPRPEGDAHKYARGAVVVVSGGRDSSGAARLSAHGAARAGAGAVTVASPKEALPIHASRLDAIMVRDLGEPCDLAGLLAERGAACVLGPGAGRGKATRERVLGLLATGLPAVLDADALTSFEDDPDTLFSALHEACVLTPHEGEFARLFGRSGADKLTRATVAAERAGATVLLKGADTVIAAPGALPVISTHGAPWLATAGSGDCLAGVVAALMAQGADAREAASAGAWLHGEAGRRGGAGLVADDLPALVASAYAALLDSSPRPF